VRRVRIRQSELERFVSAKDSTQLVEQSQPFKPDLSAALADAQRANEANDPVELAAALRNLATTADRLAEALEKGER
jgi:hypothetical protein